MKEKCTNHPTKEALSFCHHCGKYFCSDCLNEGREYYYCNSSECCENYKSEINTINYMNLGQTQNPVPSQARHEGGLNLSAPSFNYSRYSSRLLAFIIDFIILFILNTTLAYLLSLEPTEKLFHIGQFLIFRHPLFYATSILYFTLFEFSSKQATLGKQLLKIIVTDSSGSRIKLSTAFLRNFIKAFIPVVAMWLIFSNKNNRLLHDVMAKTFVLRRSTESTKSPLINFGLITILLLIVFYTFYPKDQDILIDATKIDEENSQDMNVSNFLKFKLNQQNEYLLSFAQRDQTLWSKFNREVKNDTEIHENILTLDDLIPLYAEKDSVLISIYQEILNAVDKSSKWKKGAPEFINALRIIISKGTLLTSENQKYLLYLRNYYQALNTADNKNANKYWTLYEKSSENVQLISNDLIPIIASITKEDISKTLDEIEKKFYK